jgi:hypothetical protein
MVLDGYTILSLTTDFTGKYTHKSGICPVPVVTPLSATYIGISWCLGYRALWKGAAAGVARDMQ